MIDGRRIASRRGGLRYKRRSAFRILSTTLLSTVVILIAFVLAGPTGPRVDSAAAASCTYDPFNLGSIRSFVLFGLDPSGASVADWEIGSPDTTINGDMGIGPGNTGTLDKGTLNGDLYIHNVAPLPTTTVGSNFVINGSTFNTDLSGPNSDGLAAWTFWSAQASTNHGAGFSDNVDPLTITGDTTIELGAGLNVIDITSLDIVKATITIDGNGLGGFVVFNVADGGTFSWNNGAMVLTGGVTAADILWNFKGTTATDVTLSKLTSTFYGTILSPYRPVSLDKAVMFGAIYGGAHIRVHSGAQITWECTPTTTTTTTTTASTTTTTTASTTTTTTTTASTTTTTATTTTTTASTTTTTTVPGTTSTTTTSSTTTTTTVPGTTSTTTTTTTATTSTVPETTTTTTTTSKTQPGATPTPFNGADTGSSGTPPAGTAGSGYLTLALLFGSAGLLAFAIAPWRRRRSG